MQSAIKSFENPELQGRRQAKSIWSFAATKLDLFKRQLLLVDTVRSTAARIRYIYFVKICRRLKTNPRIPEAVAKNTIVHNLKGLVDLSVSRSVQLIRPLSVIETVRPDAKILTIGPRTEGELLNLVAHGFESKNIRGLDLISYSPWVDLGDMHDMPYPENSWDVIIASCVLPYSENKRKAAAEFLRVIRSGGVIAIADEHHPWSNEKIQDQLGYLPGASERLTSPEDILKLFGNHVKDVYFRHDVLPEGRGAKGLIAAIFSVQK